jgi:hypothetical protein
MISLLSVSRLSHSYVQGLAGLKFTHGQSNTSNLNFVIIITSKWHLNTSEFNFIIIIIK